VLVTWVREMVSDHSVTQQLAAERTILQRARVWPRPLRTAGCEYEYEYQ
jgi:hypothetical protein